MPKKRNPNPINWERQSTASKYYALGVIYSEGSPYCQKRTDRKGKVGFEVGSCDKKMLEPLEAVLKAKKRPDRSKHVICKPEDFPPDGKGNWRIRKEGKQALELLKEGKNKGLTSPTFEKKWNRKAKECGRDDLIL